MGTRQATRRISAIQRLGDGSNRFTSGPGDPDYRLLFESAPHPCLVLRADAPRFTVAAVNHAFLRATGFSRDAIVGHPVLHMLSSPNGSDEQGRKLIASLERVTETRTVDSSGIQALQLVRHGHLRSATQDRLWNAASSPVLGPDGTATHILQQLEETTRFVERERQRDEWISLIAHDLLQPVNTVAGYAQLLSRSRGRPMGDDTWSRYTDHIRRASELLARMIRDLLDASQLDAQRLTLRCGDVDLTAVVRNAIDALPGDGTRCRLRATPGADLHAWADADRIQQVVSNLLTNAIKYSDPTTSIGIAITREEYSLHVSVENSGSEIPEDDLARIFERFERGSKVRGSGVSGLGLGLHISRGLIQAHRGRIWAERTPGGTTRFHFTLPVTQRLPTTEKDSRREPPIVVTRFYNA